MAQAKREDDADELLCLHSEEKDPEGQVRPPNTDPASHSEMIPDAAALSANTHKGQNWQLFLPNLFFKEKSFILLFIIRKHWKGWGVGKIVQSF